MRDGFAEAERGPRRGPGQRHSGAVPTEAVVLPAAEERGILPVLSGDVPDLVQPQLLALVKVSAAGEGEHEHRCGPGTA